jgi:hypothetical protein
MLSSPYDRNEKFGAEYNSATTSIKTAAAQNFAIPDPVLITCVRRQEGSTSGSAAKSLARRPQMAAMFNLMFARFAVRGKPEASFWRAEQRRGSRTPRRPAKDVWRVSI